MIDTDGTPLAKANVRPWALRRSQGHSLWREGDERVGFGPKQVVTDSAGVATILYLLGTYTTSVFLYVDHPNFAYVDLLNVSVPLEADGPSEIELTPGCPVEVRPLIDGESAELALEANHLETAALNR